MNGYTKHQRERFNHPLFRGEKLCRLAAWDWLVAHAAWREHAIMAGGAGTVVRRGQLSYSVRYLAEVWHWSKSKVQRFLARLRAERMIETGTAGGTGVLDERGTGQQLITVCNYEKYQAPADEGGTAETGTPTGTARDAPSGTAWDSADPGNHCENRDGPAGGGTARDTPTGTGGGTNKKAGIKKKEVRVEEATLPLVISPRGAAPEPEPEAAEPDLLPAVAAEPAPPPEPVNDVSQAVRAWNEFAEALGLPRVQKLTQARRRALAARLAEVDGPEGWAVALDRARASPFLMGQTHHNFQLTFDFMIRQSSFTKLMEGNYHDRAKRGGAQDSCAYSTSDVTNDAIRIRLAQRRDRGLG